MGEFIQKKIQAKPETKPAGIEGRLEKMHRLEEIKGSKESLKER